jgi:transcription initiation factor TFIIB
MIIRDSRTSLERGCAGARKIRLGLDLVESCPPGRQDALRTVLDALRVTHSERDLHAIEPLAREFLQVADTRRIGPGTSRLTIAAASVYAAIRTVGLRVTRRDVADAVSPLVETTVGRVGTYSCEIRRVDGEIEG